MESGQNDVVIEHCKNCKAHDWCTKHEEAKYTSFYEKTKAEIESQCPEVIVHENYEHPMLRQILEASSKRSPFPKPSFPRMGSFEVYFRGQVISSKLQSGIWPHPGAVANKIREILDGVQQPRQAKTQNDFNSRKNAASPPRAAQAAQKPKQAPAKPAQVKQNVPKSNEEAKKKEEPKIEQPKKIHSPEYDYNFENDSMPRSPVQQLHEEHETYPKKEEKHEIVKEEPPHHDEPKHETKPIEAVHEVHQSFHSEHTEKHEEVHHEVNKHHEEHQTLQEESHHVEAQSHHEESYHEEHKSYHESQHEDPSHQSSYYQDPSHQPSYNQTPSNHSYQEALSQKSLAQEAPSHTSSTHQTPSHYNQSHTSSVQQTPSHHETPAKEQEDPSRSEHYTEEFHESDHGEPEKQSYSGEYEESSHKGPEVESNHEEPQENPENAENSYENEAYEAEKQEPATEPPYPLTSNIAADILVGETKQKKISISNDSDEEQQYHIEITNPELIEIKEQDISLPPNGKGKIQLVFKPIDEPCQKTTYLIIQQDGVVKDCYEIKIDYITNN